MLVLHRAQDPGSAFEPGAVLSLHRGVVAQAKQLASTVLLLPGYHLVVGGFELLQKALSRLSHANPERG